MYIPNTNKWISYYDHQGQHGHNPYTDRKKTGGKQFGGGSLTGSHKGFISPIGAASIPHSEEKVNIQLVSPIKQTDDMAQDIANRENITKGTKRKKTRKDHSVVKKRRRSKTHKKVKTNKKKYSTKIKSKPKLSARKKSFPSTKKKRKLSSKKKSISSTKKKHINLTKSFKDIFA